MRRRLDFGVRITSSAEVAGFHSSGDCGGGGGSGVAAAGGG